MIRYYRLERHNIEWLVGWALNYGEIILHPTEYTHIYEISVRFFVTADPDEFERIARNFNKLGRLLGENESSGREPSPEPERLTLKEALKVAQDSKSVVPGAISGSSYVYYDEEHGRWLYVPDFTATTPDMYSLYDDQLDSIVVYALKKEWTPVSNFQY